MSRPNKDHWYNRQANGGTPSPSGSGYTTRAHDSPSDADLDERARNDRNLMADLRAQLQQQQTMYDQLYEDFENLRNSSPPPSSVSRSKSLFELGEDVKAAFRARFQYGSRPSMLPPQQQQVANMAMNINEKQQNLILLASIISITEVNNGNGKLESILSQLRKQYSTKVGEIERMSNEVESARSLASNFEIDLPMPNLDNPGGYRYGPKLMDIKEIFRVTGKFNPASTNDVTFSQFWLKIVVYGRNTSLTEQDYIKILGITLYGEALFHLMTMEEKGDGLQEIVNGLAALYDD